MWLAEARLLQPSFGVVAPLLLDLTVFTLDFSNCVSECEIILYVGIGAHFLDGLRRLCLQKSFTHHLRSFDVRDLCTFIASLLDWHTANSLQQGENRLWC